MNQIQTPTGDQLMIQFLGTSVLLCWKKLW